MDRLHPSTMGNSPAPLSHPVSRAMLALGWCATALTAWASMVVFDVRAAVYMAWLCWPAALLAGFSFRLTARALFAVLCALPLFLLLALALPEPLFNPASRLTALVFLPLLAAGGVALLARDEHAVAGWWRRIPTLYKTCASLMVCVALAGGLWECMRLVTTSAISDTPAGRARVAGCYQVERGVAVPSWTDAMWPPAAARFDTARWVRPDSGPVSSRPPLHHAVGGPYWDRARIESPSGTPGWWMVDGSGSISVYWMYRGLGGFQGTFRLAGNDLVGAGKWTQDFIPLPLPLPRLLAVHLHRVDCAQMR